MRQIYQKFTLSTILTLTILLVILPSGVNAITAESIYAGYMTSYAVGDDGSLWVWGEFDGQNYVQPFKVDSIDRVAMVAPGNVAPVILKDDGTVWSLGNTHEKMDVRQVEISDVKYVACAGLSVFMIKNDGSLWACGDNREGVLGNPDVKDVTVSDPVKVPLDSVRLVVPKNGFTYAQTEDGSWWAWGENKYYELNDGTDKRKYAPVRVPVESDTTIAAGITTNVLALKKDGTVWTWGDNTGGQAGDPGVPRAEVTADYKLILVPIKSPTQVPGLNSVTAIGSSGAACIALKKDGTVWTWGQDHKSYNTNLGNLDSDSPVQVPGLSGITAAIPGDGHFFAIKDDGTVWAWGYNYAGQLGDGQVLNTMGGSCGMPVGVRVTDLLVNMPYGTGKVTLTPTATPTPTPAATPVIISATPVVSPAASVSPASSIITNVQASSETTATEPAVTDTRPSPTPVPLPSTPAEPAPGLGLNTVALLGCLLVTTGLLLEFLQRKGG